MTNFEAFHQVIPSSIKISFMKTGTPETRFSETRFSEILNLMNKLQLPFSYFTLYHDWI